MEESVIGIHLDVAQRGLGLFAYDGGDVGYDADVVLPYDTELYGKFRSSLAAPFHTDESVGIASADVGRVGAVSLMDLHNSVGRYEAEHFVAVDGAAAFRKLIAESFYRFLADGQHVACRFLVFADELEVFGCGALGLVFRSSRHLVGVDKPSCVHFAVGYVGEKLVDVFIAFLLDELHHCGFIDLYLAVFRTPHQFLLAQFGTGLKLLMEFLADLVTALRAHHYVHPVGFRRLGCRGEDLDGVTALDHMAYLAVAPVDDRSRTVRTYVGVDIEGKVKHCRSCRQLEEVALRREGIHLLGVDVHAYVFHQLHGVVFPGFEDIAYVVHPLVGGVGFHSLVAPVGGKALLRYEVHPLGAELHLHPFRVGPHHSGVQALIAVALGYGDPVAHARWVGGIHVGEDGVGEPAVAFLFLRRSVYDHSDGEEVVDAVEVYLLFPHLGPYGGYGFRAPLDGECQSGILEFLLHGCDEFLHIGVAGAFGLVQLVGDLLVDFPVGIFQGEVFEFSFYFI